MGIYIELDASNPAPPAGAQNVHFRTDNTHLGTQDDPVPTSAFLSPFTGDSGAGGASGLVPGPSAGDAAANKFLHAGGSFQTLPVTVRFEISNGATGTNIALQDAASRAGSVKKCTVVVTKSDASTPLTFKIKKNGTDVFSTDPTIAAGAAVGSIGTFTALTSSPLPIASADVFSMDIASGSSSWQFIAKLE
ncbi:MAG TPA: hypothetical protein VFW25_07350 [Silvibacterium sp.]|nr:hypothetical protein [Silvibacterium sp.]